MTGRPTRFPPAARSTVDRSAGAITRRARPAAPDRRRRAGAWTSWPGSPAGCSRPRWPAATRSSARSASSCAGRDRADAQRASPMSPVDAPASRAAWSSTCHRPMWTPSSCTRGPCRRWPGTPTWSASRARSAGAATARARRAQRDARRRPPGDRADPADGHLRPRRRRSRPRCRAACDLRVIWGGDASVDQIRRHPLAPHARDLTFPDRSSFAAVSAAGWRRRGRRPGRGGRLRQRHVLVRPGRVRLAAGGVLGRRADGRGDRPGRVHRPACGSSSQRGGASTRRWRWRSGSPRTGWRPTARPPGSSSPATRWPPSSWPRRRRCPGAGSARAPSRVTGRLAGRWCRSWTGATRRSPTSGSPPPSWTTSPAVGGRGIDRMVPFGSALTFAAIWDGYDLLHEFTRLTVGQPR